jgi:hypothetical protein
MNLFSICVSRMATNKESRMGVEVPSSETSLSRLPRLLNLCSPHATAVNTTPKKNTATRNTKCT